MAAAAAKAKRARGNGKRPMSAAKKAELAKSIEDLKTPDGERPAIEAQGQEHFKVPGPVFVEVITILNELPFGKVAGVMQALMSLRAVK